MDEKARLVILWRLAPPSSNEPPDEESSQGKESSLNLDREEKLAWKRYQRHLEAQRTVSPIRPGSFLEESIDHSDESNGMIM